MHGTDRKVLARLGFGAVLPAAAIAAFALAGCGGDKATLDTFAGTWQAHARTLKITRAGNGREWFTLGLGQFVFALQFHVSQPRGTPDDATATATVTAVRIGDRSVFSAARPAPRVGESRTIRIRDGVITGLTGNHYCGTTAGDWIDAGCGA
jgi:hypothetical protein